MYGKNLWRKAHLDDIITPSCDDPPAWAEKACLRPDPEENPGIFSLFTLKEGAKKGRKLVDRNLHELIGFSPSDRSLQSLDLNIAIPNRITMVLQTDSSLPGLPEALPVFEFTISNHSIPFWCKHLEFNHLYSI
nr:hypothetical protein [Okeania hirsuta]